MLFYNNFTSLLDSAKQLLNPIMRNPVYYIMYNIMNNWKTVVGEKYFDYCTLEKIRADHSKMDGHVVYLISYNSSASFYLSNNSQYILDRINSLFGYELATKLQVKEIPTVVRVRQQETPKQNYRDAEIENTDIDKKLGDDEILKKSLLELQKYL